MSGLFLLEGFEGPPLILLAIQDITSRRMAESIIAHQQQWFQVTLSSIGDAVIATDANAHITFINPPGEVITGWPLDQAIGKPLATIFNIVNEETRKVVESPVTKSLRRGS